MLVYESGSKVRSSCAQLVVMYAILYGMCIQGMLLAVGVHVAATVLFLRWNNRIQRSWATDVTRGRPKQCLFCVLRMLCCWYRSHR